MFEVQSSGSEFGQKPDPHHWIIAQLLSNLILAQGFVVFGSDEIQLGEKSSEQ